MKEYVKGWIGGWVNRWTEAHAMTGSGLRQGGVRNSFPYFHLKLMFSSVFFCSQPVKMQQERKRVADSSRGRVVPSFQLHQAHTL